MQTPGFLPFVDDWLCYKTILGEGAYGEVRLLVHSKTGDKIACKIIDHSKYKDAATNINREVVIHSMLHHENIIRYFGRRHEPSKEYIFLEYASGGELFQMIEPDVGMEFRAAQTFMRHLLNGLKYLHNRGIAHRDIKPENLLIDGNGVLKITDFGLATLFRFKGKERQLDKKCGTKPYLAPEVLKMPYAAQPADLWSCGIVFVAMLTGELPWSDTTDDNEEFLKWKQDNYLSESPWPKLNNFALCLARQILVENPKKRLTLQQILEHPWMNINFNRDASIDTIDGSGEKSAKRWHSMIEAESNCNRETPQVTLSQPVMAMKPHSINQLISEMQTNRNRDISFSQPARNDDVILHLTQSPITRDNFDKLVKRLTRFYVNCDYQKALESLCSALDGLNYTWTSDASGSILISTVDLMKNQLMFRVNFIKMDNKILFDFRLSKGCGLEFKKKFLKLKLCLQHIIEEDSDSQMTEKNGSESEDSRINVFEVRKHISESQMTEQNSSDSEGTGINASEVRNRTSESQTADTESQ